MSWMKFREFVFILTILCFGCYLNLVKTEDEFESTPVLLWHGMGK